MLSSVAAVTAISGLACTFLTVRGSAHEVAHLLPETKDVRQAGHGFDILSARNNVRHGRRRKLLFPGHAGLGERSSHRNVKRNFTTPENVASNTWTVEDGCARYQTVQDGDYCWKLIAENADLNASLQDFLEMNPDVDEECSNLQIGLGYCVGSGEAVEEPLNIAQGSLTIGEGCSRFYTVVQNDTCLGILASHVTANMTLETFYVLNPSVDSECTNLQPSQDYCVGLRTPGIALEGSASAEEGCHRYHTVVAGDTCDDIVLKVNNPSFTLKDFYAANPSIDSTCSNLWIDTAVCVGVLTTNKQEQATSKRLKEETSSVTEQSSTADIDGDDGSDMEDGVTLSRKGVVTTSSETSPPAAATTTTSHLSSAREDIHTTESSATV